MSEYLGSIPSFHKTTLDYTTRIVSTFLAFSRSKKLGSTRLSVMMVCTFSTGDTYTVEIRPNLVWSATINYLVPHLDDGSVCHGFREVVVGEAVFHADGMDADNDFICP